MKIKAKDLFSVSAALLMLVLSAFVVSTFFGRDWFSNIKAEITSQPYARTISVNAEGKITVKPDIAIVNLSVVSRAQSVKLVVKDGNEKMQKVMDAVKNLGVDADDIQSTSYDLYPNYDYMQRTPRITGYNLTQGITVKIRALEKVEDVLDAGLAAGSNQIGQLYFDIDDASAIKKEAREQAFKIAKEKAEEMCKSAGVKLGRVITFSEGVSYPVSPYPNYAMDMRMEQSSAEIYPSTAIEPGSKDITVNMNVTYEIE